MRAGPASISAREHTGVGERHQGDGAAADHHRADISVADPRNDESGQTLRKGTQNRHAGTRGEVERSNDYGRTDHRNQDARHALAAAEKEDHCQRGHPEHKSRPVRSSLHYRAGDRPQVSQRSCVLDRETKKRGDLADQYRQCNSVHVAVPDRLRDQLGNETQPRDAGQDAHRARNDRQHARKRHGAQRVAAG